MSLQDIFKSVCDACPNVNRKEIENQIGLLIVQDMPLEEIGQTLITKFLNENNVEKKLPSPLLPAEFVAPDNIILDQNKFDIDPYYPAKNSTEIFTDRENNIWGITQNEPSYHRIQLIRQSNAQSCCVWHVWDKNVNNAYIKTNIFRYNERIEKHVQNLLEKENRQACIIPAETIELGTRAFRVEYFLSIHEHWPLHTKRISEADSQRLESAIPDSLEMGIGTNTEAEEEDLEEEGERVMIEGQAEVRTHPPPASLVTILSDITLFPQQNALDQLIDYDKKPLRDISPWNFYTAINTLVEIVNEGVDEKRNAIRYLNSILPLKNPGGSNDTYCGTNVNTIAGQAQNIINQIQTVAARVLTYRVSTTPTFFEEIPERAVLRALGSTEIQLVEKGSRKYNSIAEVVTSQANYNFELYEVNRVAEEKAFEPYKNQPGRVLLYHGTKTPYVLSILAFGLRCCRSTMDGVYGRRGGCQDIFFSTHVNYSLGYTDLSQNRRRYYFLCEVFFGNNMNHRYFFKPSSTENGLYVPLPHAQTQFNISNHEQVKLRYLLVLLN